MNTLRTGGCLTLILLLLPTLSCGTRDRQPSIVLINVDTLRADYLGSYGFQGDVSPNLDRLAAESLRFRNCFAQAPWTKPSVATLFTSLYPQVHGLTNHEGAYWGAETPSLQSGVLHDDAWTLAEALRSSGYATAGFVANPWLSSAYGFSQGFDHYDEDETHFLVTLDDLAEDALRWLDERDSSQPFFLYLHPMDVHAPYAAPREDFEALRDSPDVRSIVALEPDAVPDLRWRNLEIRPDWAGDELRRTVQYWRARYASGVRAFDRRLGAFLSALDERGLLDDALLIVTSDHGEELYEHGSWSHGQTLHGHQLHVPLIVRLPDEHKIVGESHVFFDLLDLMPTLVSWVGADAGSRAQGQDLSPLFSGSTPPREAQSFAGATQREPGWHSIRTDEHKLLFNIDDERAQLYDVRSDPDESENLARRMPSIREKLKDSLLIHIRDSEAGGRLDPQAKQMPEELRRRLEALGYLN